MDDIRVLLAAVAVTTLIVFAGAALAEDRQPERPSAAFCWQARALVTATGSERAAEAKARSWGASEATIAQAKRCRR